MTELDRKLDAIADAVPARKLCCAAARATMTRADAIADAMPAAIGLHGRTKFRATLAKAQAPA